MGSVIPHKNGNHLRRREVLKGIFVRQAEVNMRDRCRLALKYRLLP